MACDGVQTERQRGSVHPGKSSSSTAVGRIPTVLTAGFIKQEGYKPMGG